MAADLAEADSAAAAAADSLLPEEDSAEVWVVVASVATAEADLAEAAAAAVEAAAEAIADEVAARAKLHTG